MDEDIKLNSISSETCFVPDTNQGKERRAAVVSRMTAAPYLHYGRILSWKHKAAGTHGCARCAHSF